MNLAVKFYENMPSDDENVLAGIDGKIPAEVRFNVDTAPDDTFTMMTSEEYSDYMVSIKPELEEWTIIQKQMPVQEEITEE